jgi:uncharacterized protein YciI
MYFFVHAVDKPGHEAVRQQHRPAHLEYLEANVHRILAGGAKLSDDGERALGSVLLIEAADRADAEAFMEGDPFARAGLFERVEITRWRKAYPKG